VLLCEHTPIENKNLKIKIKKPLRGEGGGNPPPLRPAARRTPGLVVMAVDVVVWPRSPPLRPRHPILGRHGWPAVAVVGRDVAVAREW